MNQLRFFMRISTNFPSDCLCTIFLHVGSYSELDLWLIPLNR